MVGQLPDLRETSKSSGLRCVTTTIDICGIERCSRLKMLWYMTSSQMLKKVESTGGPIFKVVLECQKGVLNLFMSISMAYNVIFGGNLRSTGISQLRAGKTLSKKGRNLFLSQRRLFPYLYRPFQLLWPITISLFVFELEAKK